MTKVISVTVLLARWLGGANVSLYAAPVANRAQMRVYIYDELSGRSRAEC